ncbi:hypothetical protein [Zoogloea sp.]|uniref:hypothetical protein n=1 Tax=Zoogloea sp. TaxID=49181 RepID=UPI001416155C|nr:MAG: hypothetical protein F9K15_22055 [Zoogloea sp.]
MNQSSDTSTVVKKGNVNKCPSCGAQLGAFVSSCQSCGHEITDVEANRSITTLVSRLEEVEREVDEKGLTGRRREQTIVERRARVIRDFPVPNSREDLQQLLYFIQPKLIESVKPDPNTEDWRAKFNEVVSRAKNAYKNDSSALAEFEEIEASLSTPLSTGLAIRAKRNPLFVALLVGITLLGLVGLVGSMMERSKERQCEEKYTAGALAEKERLEKLYAQVDQDYKGKRYTEAVANASKLVWEYTEPCKVDDAAASKGVWDEKRIQISALIQKGIEIDAAEKEAAANRELAEKQADADRELAAKQAEAQKETELARIATEKERARIAEVRRKELDKKW